MTEPLYASEKRVAQMLGHDLTWFRENVDALEKQFGFPKVDPATGRRHIPSIRKWAETRNRLRNGALSETSGATNDNAF